MIYCVPANAADEVSALKAAGAGELYCGLQEAWWQERYGDHDSMSRRQGRANLRTREELARLVDVACVHDLPVYLALNGHYDEDQLEYLVELCAAYEHMGGAGVIVRDLGLLWRLREAGSGLVRVLSLLAVCANARSAHAFARLGISRIVLPRFIDAHAAQTVLHAVPGMEAESMLFFDKCPLVDGYCNHYHGVGYRPRTGADAALPGTPLPTFCTTYTTHACMKTNCAYTDPDPCGACEATAFEGAGVRFGKLGGRGRPLSERLRALEFLRAAEACADDAERTRLYERTFGHACSCYYGRATQRAGAIERPDVTPDPTRTYWGSQTDVRAFAHDTGLLARSVPHNEPLTLLVPPLTESWLRSDVGRRAMGDLECWLDVGATDVRVCANDVGTLVLLSSMARTSKARGVCVTAGSLLAGGGVPVELDKFLSAEKNPDRLVWDADGNSRILTYQKPPEELLAHWTQGLRLSERPSVRAALSYLTGGMSVGAEF